MTWNCSQVSTSAMVNLSQTVFASIVLAFGYIIYLLFNRHNPASKLGSFPGPPADPLIGHARVMPQDYAWKTFAEWKKKFGDVIYVYILNKPFIILNSLESARELLDKRGVNYSDRPRFVLFQELMGWDSILAFLRYGERFKKQRKLMQQHWNGQNVVAYRPIQRAEVHTLLMNLFRSPEAFEKHIGRAVSAMILLTTYGYEIQSDDDPYVRLVEVTNRMTVESGSPGGTLVDFFPVLKHIPTWFPGAGFKRHALTAKRLIQDMIEIPFEMVRKERTSGTARPSFVNSLLDEYEKSGVVDLDYEKEMKAVAGNIYGAGVETTTTTLLTFVLSMTLHPSVARKAQKEIDEVVGNLRLPDFEDREHLPYIDCILKEIFRWNPPLPLCLPHSAMKQDNYLGKVIPEGAMMIPNIWAILRDSESYPDPERFDPDRFLIKGRPKTGQADGIDAEDFEPTSIIFGFGRRICPGRFFADAGIWLAMACILACFDILPPLDENGKEVMPAAEFVTGTTSQPKPFHCRLVLRYQKYENVIRHAVKSI